MKRKKLLFIQVLAFVVLAGCTDPSLCESGEGNLLALEAQGQVGYHPGIKAFVIRLVQKSAGGQQSTDGSDVYVSCSRSLEEFSGLHVVFKGKARSLSQQATNEIDIIVAGEEYHLIEIDDIQISPVE